MSNSPYGDRIHLKGGDTMSYEYLGNLAEISELLYYARNGK